MLGPALNDTQASVISLCVCYSFTRETLNQRKTIVNSWVRCLENNQIVINSGFPTVNCGK